MLWVFFAGLHPTLIDGNGKSESEPGFLVTLQIRSSVSTSPVSSPSLCLEKARKGTGKRGGLLTHTISQHTGPPLKFSTYTFSIDGGSRAACRFSDKRKAFENRGESVYSCLKERA